MKICVDFWKLNAATKKDPYLLPFTNEVINIIVGHEVYTFLDGFLVSTKSLILYFGLKFGLKYNKTNINKVCSFRFNYN